MRLARVNPRWGYLRIVAEARKVQVGVSATSVRTILRRYGLGPAPARSRNGPSWVQFLRALTWADVVFGTHRSRGDQRILTVWRDGVTDTEASATVVPYRLSDGEKTRRRRHRVQEPRPTASPSGPHGRIPVAAIDRFRTGEV